MKNTLLIALRVIVAIILVQTLRYKFTGHPDSIYIFTTVGMEPYGRIGLGILELIASVLILVPKTVWMGAGLAMGILFGAIVMHLTILGININEDGGLLFYTAIATFILSGVVLWAYRKEIPVIGQKFS